MSKEPQTNVFYEMNEFLKRVKIELSGVYTVIDQKICFNCLFKKASNKRYKIFKFKCRLNSCGKNHPHMMKFNQHLYIYTIAALLITLSQVSNPLVQSSPQSDPDNEERNQSVIVTNDKIKTTKSKFCFYELFTLITVRR